LVFETAVATAALDPTNTEACTETSRAVAETAMTVVTTKDGDAPSYVLFIVVTQDYSETEGGASEGMDGGEVRRGTLPVVATNIESRDYFVGTWLGT
jgi:hypothetical protein